MNISFIHLSELKNRFGSLLSFLAYDCHIGVDNISEALISSKLLDMLEENKLDEFMSLSFEDIANKLFPNVIIDKKGRKDIGEIYWSGLQYMNIFLNYKIPLRTIILLCPLKEMIKKYQIFHEMNEIMLCKDFLNNEYVNKSILQCFRKRRDVSTRQLSLLTGLSEPGIKRMESNNENLFNASSQTVFFLSDTLGIDHTFLKRKSSFIPATYNLLSNNEFVSCLADVIARFLLLPQAPKLSIQFYKDEKKETGKAYLYAQGIPYIVIDNKEKYFNDSVFAKLVDISIDEYIKSNLKENLVF